MPSLEKENVWQSLESSDYLEISVNQGSAVRVLGLTRDDVIEIRKT